MSVSLHHLPTEGPLCACGAALPDPGGDANRLLWLVRRIAGDDGCAFAELFTRCSGPVLHGLRGQVSDPNRVAGVFAGTFVEVWWLAGGHVDPGSDVMAWIDQIVQRRVTDSRPARPSREDSAANDGSMFNARWARGVEVDLARLLRRHRATW